MRTGQAVGFDQGAPAQRSDQQETSGVLLLDEDSIEYPDIYKILLQDHGKLTDNNGRQADFRNVILVMTTNAGAESIKSGHRLFGKAGERRRMADIKRMFSPEFASRLGKCFVATWALESFSRPVDKSSSCSWSTIARESRGHSPTR